MFHFISFILPKCLFHINAALKPNLIHSVEYTYIISKATCYTSSTVVVFFSYVIHNTCCYVRQFIITRQRVTNVNILDCLLKDLNFCCCPWLILCSSSYFHAVPVKCQKSLLINMQICSVIISLDVLCYGGWLVHYMAQFVILFMYFFVFICHQQWQEFFIFFFICYLIWCFNVHFVS